MTTAVSVVLANARNMLMGTTHDATNTLNTTISSSATTSVVFVTNDTKLLPASGSTIEIDTEIMYVSSMSGTTATVVRGFLGSTAASSHTSGAIIRIDPKVYDTVLLSHLNGELMDLCSPTNGLYQQKHVDITWNASNTGYDLTSTTTVEDILDVRYKTPDATKAWPRATWDFARDMLTTDFASGNAIMIQRGGSPGQTVRVFYKAPYSTVSATTDTLESTAGMHAEAVDIPAIGVAIRAQAGAEVARNFIQSQASTRRAGEVPAGANNNAVAGLRLLRASRIQAEASRLQTRWRYS
jgi:hypothetical protein